MIKILNKFDKKYSIDLIGRLKKKKCEIRD